MLYDITVENGLLVVTTRTESGKYLPEQHTYHSASTELGENCLLIFEEGNLKQTLKIHNFGTVGGVTPTSISQANDLVVALIPTSSGGGVQEIIAGTNVTVDSTNPLKPIVSSTGGGGSQNLQQTYNNGGEAFPFAVVRSDDGLTEETISFADASDDGGVKFISYDDGGGNVSSLEEKAIGQQNISDSDDNDSSSGTTNYNGLFRFFRTKRSTLKTSSIDIEEPIANTTTKVRAKDTDGTYYFATEDQIVTVIPYTPDETIVGIGQTSFPVPANTLVSAVFIESEVINKLLWTQSGIGEDVIVLTAGDANRIQFLGQTYSSAPTLTGNKKAVYFITNQDDTGFLDMIEKYNNTGVNFTFTRSNDGVFQVPQYDKTKYLFTFMRVSEESTRDKIACFDDGVNKYITTFIDDDRTDFFFSNGGWIKIEEF